MAEYVPTEETATSAVPVPLNPPVKPQHFSKTTRYEEISKLAAYFRGTQYDGRPDWWTGVAKQGDEPVPLRERKPCIVSKLPKAAVQQAVRFTFGAGKFPDVLVPEVKPDAALPGAAISKDDATVVQAYLAELIEQAALKPRIRSLMRNGCHARTAVAILLLVDGCFSVQIARAQDCWPIFRNDNPSSELVGITWCYEFDKLGQNAKGEPETARYYFRRDITTTHDIAFVDVEKKPGVEPEWKIDFARTREHGFGFCPAIWIRNLEEEGCEGEIDGTSLYENLFDEFDSLNLALSQRHKGIHHVGSPQPVETGVDKGDGPSATGRKGGSGGYGPADKQPVDAFAVSPGPARKTGPDRTLSYKNEHAKFDIVETTGKAFEAATNHVNDSRHRALETMGVMMVDAEKVVGKGDMSAKFLALAYAPFLGLVDELRDCWWPNALRPLLSMALRITVELKGQGILLARASAVAGILASRIIEFEQRKIWIEPKMVPSWGDYFSPSNDEIKVGTDAAATAKEKGLVSAKTATGFVAEYMGVPDVDEEVLAIEAEAEERQQKALELAQQQKPPAPDEKPGTPAQKPAPASGE